MFKILKNSVQSPKLKKVKSNQGVKGGWLYVFEPNGGEIEKISKTTKVSLETLEDCLDEYELSRSEFEKKKLIIILRTPVLSKKVWRTFPLTVIFGEDLITTISPKKLELLEDFATSKKRIYTAHKTKMLIQICQNIIHAYQKQIGKINKTVQDERSRFRQISQQEIARLVESEEVLNDLLSSLQGTTNTMKKVFSSKGITVHQGDQDLVDDLLIDAEQVLDLANTNLKTIRNIRDGYSTLMSMRLNQVMKLLTYVTVLFTIPMIITGFFGMNVALPWAGHPDAFLFIFALTIVLLVVFFFLIIFFKRKL